MRFTYANVISTLALFLALGGASAYAGIKLITGSQIASGTITARNIAKESLLSKDFAPGQLPAGKRGANGDTGATGAQGEPGKTGPAGSALAYATVVVTNFVNAENSSAAFTGSQTGFTSVSEPSGDGGIFCVSPVFTDANGNLIEPTVTLYGTYENAEPPLIIHLADDVCGQNAYQVDTLYINVGAPQSPLAGSGFTIAVP